MVCSFHEHLVFNRPSWVLEREANNEHVMTPVSENNSPFKKALRGGNQLHTLHSLHTPKPKESPRDSPKRRRGRSRFWYRRGRVKHQNASQRWHATQMIILKTYQIPHQAQHIHRKSKGMKLVELHQNEHETSHQLTENG